MIKLIAAAGFLGGLRNFGARDNSVPIPQPDGMLSQVRLGVRPVLGSRVAGHLRGQNHYPPYRPTSRPPSLPPGRSSCQPGNRATDCVIDRRVCRLASTSPGGKPLIGNSEL